MVEKRSNIEENKDNEIKQIKIEVFVLLVFILYICIFMKWGVGIPCIFKSATGYDCPGCGMTHAMGELVKGEFTKAWSYNAISITVFPLICIYLLYRIISEKIFGRERFYIWELVFLVFVFIVVVLYGYFRNFV